MSTYTYRDGFHLRAERDITNKDIAKCFLMITLNEYSQSQGYWFVPEAITEGGIRMVRFPY